MRHVLTIHTGQIYQGYFFLNFFLTAWVFICLYDPSPPSSTTVWTGEFWFKSTIENCKTKKPLLFCKGGEICVVFWKLFILFNLKVHLDFHSFYANARIEREKTEKEFIADRQKDCTAMSQSLLLICTSSLFYPGSAFFA